MRVLIVRHADPDHDRDALTAFGEREARALAEAVRALAPARLFTSPAGRARATAAAIAAATGLPATVEPWTDERRPASGWATARCIGLGDVGHLRAAGLERNHAGLNANVE